MYITVVIYLSLFFLIELCYFAVADRFNIIDKPNNRSSHTYVTIRGGGIIFVIASLIWFVQNNQFPFFFLGLFLIATISLIDDIRSLPSGLRFTIHFLAAALLAAEIGNQSPVYLYPLIILIVIANVNIYNFMDGINGLTALYSIVGIATLMWINATIAFILPEEFYIFLLLSLVVFSFFNLRQKAKCFSGDVGSISIGFIIISLVVMLVFKTGSVIWLLLIAVYGIDAYMTLLFRIIRKEPVHKAHRSHFYQFLVNEKKYGHLQVSIGYALTQLLINVVIVESYKAGSSIVAVATLVAFVSIYLIFRLRLEGKYRLFTAY